MCAPPWAICGIVNSRWFTIRIIDRIWIAALVYDACKCFSSFFRSFCNYSLSLHIISVVQRQSDHVLSNWAFTCISSAKCFFPNRIGCQNRKKTSNFLNNMDGWAAAIADACAQGTYINIHLLQWFAIKNACSYHAIRSMNAIRGHFANLYN